ncbi:MAG: glycosyltransferase, partial [Proteobacteria bacterium]|nr:glycosyltransferase [Pseudomonadota bacterium]
MKPAVSIIIPTYNRSAFLQEAIDSVLAQSYSPYEIIVVDDGSADDTPEVVKAYESKVRYIRRENSGPAAARNTGIKAARSDYIAFLDDDDRFDKRKLEIQVKAMVDNPGFLVSHTQEIWFRRGKHLNQKIKHRK